MPSLGSSTGDVLAAMIQAMQDVGPPAERLGMRCLDSCLHSQWRAAHDLHVSCSFGLQGQSRDSFAGVDSRVH
jgi:hypothetical protein